MWKDAGMPIHGFNSSRMVPQTLKFPVPMCTNAELLERSSPMITVLIKMWVV